MQSTAKGIWVTIEVCGAGERDTATGFSEYLCQNFFIIWFTGIFFQIKGRGGGGDEKKNKIKKLWKWPVNWSFSELFFFFFFFLIFSELFFFKYLQKQ